jgi:uncharacterized membrane protein HdeD (DUF308 family)
MAHRTSTNKPKETKETDVSNIGFFDSSRHNSLLGRIEEFGHRWGWYFALGVFLIALGALAAATAVWTTLLSVVALGWILLFAGAALVVLSFLTGRWSGFLLSLAAGVLSGITGIMLLRAPLSGAAALTLVIAAFLTIAGIYRAVSSIVMRFPNWGWSLFSGIVSVALGAILIAGWPEISLWFLGLYVGIDLMFHGFAWIMFSLSVRNLVRGLETRGEFKRGAA